LRFVISPLLLILVYGPRVELDILQRGLREFRDKRAAEEARLRKAEARAAAAPPSPTPSPKQHPPTGSQPKSTIAIGRRGPSEGGAPGGMEERLTRLRRGTVALEERRARGPTISTKGMDRNEIINLLYKVKKGRE